MLACPARGAAVLAMRSIVQYVATQMRDPLQRLTPDQQHTALEPYPFVMPGLVPGIHVLNMRLGEERRGWPGQARP
jgi:hypothetical protein